MPDELSERALHLREVSLVALARQFEIEPPTPAELLVYPGDAYLGDCWKRLLRERRATSRGQRAKWRRQAPRRHWMIRVVLFPFTGIAAAWRWGADLGARLRVALRR